MEAFDKLKAIEESDDPFCIGAKKESRNDTYTRVEEDDNDDPMVGRSDGESPDDLGWSEPEVFEIGTDSGDHYAIHFQDGGSDKLNNRETRAFIEANGITIATYKVGGAGAMDAQIQKADEVLNMLTEAMRAANGQGM